MFPSKYTLFSEEKVNAIIDQIQIISKDLKTLEKAFYKNSDIIEARPLYLLWLQKLLLGKLSIEDMYSLYFEYHRLLDQQKAKLRWQISRY